MVCGGFRCSRNSLILLNSFYIIIGIVLITAGAIAKGTKVAGISLAGGIVGCGFLLVIVAILGIFGAVRHHQVLLFFYMTIMFLLFLAQFGVACACLAISTEQQAKLIKIGWEMNKDSHKNIEQAGGCCGLNNSTVLECKNQEAHNYCCPSKAPLCECHPCETWLKEEINKLAKMVGGLGLFFSFTELIGVWLAMRYRNQKDPRADPRTFL